MENGGAHTVGQECFVSSVFLLWYEVACLG